MFAIYVRYGDHIVKVIFVIFYIRYLCMYIVNNLNKLFMYYYNLLHCRSFSRMVKSRLWIQFYTFTFIFYIFVKIIRKIGRKFFYPLNVN